MTPYGIRTGRVGNLVFAVIDAAIAGVLFRAHRRLASINRIS